MQMLEAYITQPHTVLRGISIPNRAHIYSWRYKGKWSSYLLTMTCATRLGVAMLLGKKSWGMAAIVTASSQRLQAYLGRTCAMKESFAGTFRWISLMKRIFIRGKKPVQMYFA